MRQGYSLAETHRILVKTGKICRGNKCMSYKTFWGKSKTTNKTVKPEPTNTEEP